MKLAKIRFAGAMRGECRKAAERTDNAVHRSRLLRTAREWWQEAERLRASTKLLGKRREIASSDFCCQLSNSRALIVCNSCRRWERGT